MTFSDETRVYPTSSSHDHFRMRYASPSFFPRRGVQHNQQPPPVASLLVASSVGLLLALTLVSAHF